MANNYVSEKFRQGVDYANIYLRHLLEDSGTTRVPMSWEPPKDILNRGHIRQLAEAIGVEGVLNQTYSGHTTLILNMEPGPKCYELMVYNPLTGLRPKKHIASLNESYLIPTEGVLSGTSESELKNYLVEEYFPQNRLKKAQTRFLNNVGPIQTDDQPQRTNGCGTGCVYVLWGLNQIKNHQPTHPYLLWNSPKESLPPIEPTDSAKVRKAERKKAKTDLFSYHLRAEIHPPSKLVGPSFALCK